MQARIIVCSVVLALSLAGCVDAETRADLNSALEDAQDRSSQSMSESESSRSSASSSWGGSNPDEYPWEDDDNVPDLPWSSSIPEYPGGTEDDEGEKGDTWDLPEYTPIDPPISDDDLNIPEMPLG